MSRQTANEDLLRQAVEAFNRGDEEGVIADFDPEIEFHVAPTLMNAGTRRGIDGYREMITAWVDAWQELQMDALEFEPIDERQLVARVRQRAIGAGSGVPVELEVFFLFEVNDGRVVRFHIYADRESAIAAF
jgi:ketosteroid isomerase-like protein